MTAVIDAELWQRAKHVFDRVVDLPLAERDAQIDASCAEMPELRRMVLGLLAADAEIAEEPTPAVTVLGRMVDPELLPGTRIGAFEVERLLGSGGMGRVYLGHRVDGRVEQSVAIKTIRGALAGRDLLQRFQRERRILARLNHPHIAHFVDAGETSDGAPFVAMEYIAGTPLLDYAKQQRLSLIARLRLFVKIASAVDYAHRQLVVHRDLKPGNVLVDAAGEPKLLDFGIAKSIRQQHEQMLLDGRTAPESRYFSLRHAAPEQISGAAEGVSVDIYALGGLLYELLSGRPALDLEQLSLAEAQARITREMPRAPSLLCAAELPYDGRVLRGDLDRIVLHTLKKEPELRYASAAMLIDDIQRVLEHRPISLRASHRWYLLGRFFSRHRVATVMGSILLLTTVGAAVVYRQQRDIAVRERARAEAVNSILIEAFEGADPSRNKGERLSARDVLQQAKQVLSRRTDLDGSARSALLLSLSEVHNSLGLFVDSRALAEQSLAAASTDDERLKAEFHLAVALFSGGDAALAKPILMRLQQLPRTQGDPRWQLRIKLMMVSVESYLGSIVLPLAAEAHAYAMRTLGADDPMTLDAAIVYASQLSTRQETMQQAAQFLAQLIDRQRSDTRSPQWLELLRIATRVERELKHLPESLSYARRHLELAELLYSKEHGSYVAAEGMLARALLVNGKTAEARATYAQSVERARAVYGVDSAALAVLANNAGDAALAEPIDLPLALGMTAIAVGASARAIPPESRQMAFFLWTRAKALMMANDDVAALDAATRSSHIFLATLEQSRTAHAEVELIAAVAEHRLARSAAAQARLAALGSDLALVDRKSLAALRARELNLINGATP